MASQKIVEGIFAINKPPFLTSAQVLRELQRVFNTSALFKPWILAQEHFRAEEDARQPHQRRRRHRRNKPIEVKLGHGGTLDPMATGVLIIGVGKGTKSLSQFLECTKAYEANVLFGVSTDTYDISGRTLARADFEHVTKEMVDGVLENFRGDISQKPPVYSALRVQGKRLYEYAREGKELPTEIQDRRMKVSDMELVGWSEPAEHEFRWPIEEASEEEKLTTKALQGIEGDASGISSLKRKVDTVEGSNESEPSIQKLAKVDRLSDSNKPLMEDLSSSVLQAKDAEAEASTVPMGEPQKKPQTTFLSKRAQHTHDQMPPQSGPKADAPVAKLSMTVSSGFYVRSFCHDLGKAVNSLGVMATLVRTRQGQFELGKNVLEFDDICRNEEIWGPRIESMLNDWNQRENP